MPAWTWLLGLLGAVSTVSGSPTPPPLRDLPLLELPVTHSHGTFAIVLTGDGGWAAGDQGMAVTLRRNGIPVVGFLSPSYLQVPRTTAGVGRDLERLLKHYLAEWQCQRVVIFGYSRGADLVPFMVSRLTPELRREVSGVTLIGLGKVASLQYRPTDLFADALRFNDFPVSPELSKLRGIRLMCIAGERERGSLCPAVDPTLARVTTHPGGHRLTRAAGEAIVTQTLRYLDEAPRDSVRIRAATAR